MTPDLSIDFSVWGQHPVSEACASKFVQVRSVYQLSTMPASEKKNFSFKGPIKSLPMSELNKKAMNQTHQGVAADVSLKLWSHVDFLGETPGKKLVVVLDQVEDPQNFGSILRTACFMKVSAVVFPKDHCAPINGTVAKASAGGIFGLNLVKVTNLSRVLEDLADQNFWRLGLEASAQTDVFSYNSVHEKVAVVMGGEGKGLRRLTAQNCDEMLKILGGGLESLNVSVAAGITLAVLSNKLKT